MKVVEVRDIHKKFQKDKVLKGVSFDVNKGDFCILIGHNGAGKSTVLNLIVQNDFHDEGKICVFGEDIGHEGVFHDKKVGFVHEKINYKMPLTMEKMIEILKSEYETWDDEFFWQMVRDRNIPMNKNFVNYSRGQKMQLSLMITLARRPELILVDEITSVLDIAGQKYFLSILQEMCMNGSTVIMTTNIISEAQNICNKIIYLKDGKAMFADTKDDFLAPYIKIEVPNSLIKDSEFGHYEMTLTEKAKSFSYFLIEREKVVNRLPAGCREVPATLEDVFLHFYKYKRNENAA